MGYDISSIEYKKENETNPSPSKATTGYRVENGIGEAKPIRKISND